MKVYISADIEGVAGVSQPAQCRKGNADHEAARRLMTQEACAAVRGAFDAGATAVVVADSHATMQNILADELDPRARLISGSPRPHSMAGGLTADIDALVLLGYHSAAGTAGVLSHTCNGMAFAHIEIDGRAVGETELFAGHAADLGVPLAVVTGDDRLALEASALFSSATTVVVKESLGAFAANSLSPSESRELIENAVRTTLASMPVDRLAPINNGAFVVEIDMTRQVFADGAALLPNVRRLSATRIAYDAQDYSEAIRHIQVLSYMAKGIDA